MDQQQLSDQIEIQQLCARYMMLSARKDNDHWRDVFTDDGVYNAFGTPYGLDALPDAPQERAARAVHRQPARRRLRRRHRHRRAALRVHRPDVARDATRLVRGRVRAHRRRLAHPLALHHVHAPQRWVRPRQRARPRRASSPAKRSSRDVTVRIGIMVGPETRRYARQGRPDGRRRQGGGGGGVRDRVDPAAPAGLRRDDRGRAHGPRDEPHRARHRGGAAAVAPPDRARAAGAVGAGGVRRSLPPRRRAVAPLDHRLHARPALRAAREAGRELPRRVRRDVRRAEPGRRRERPLPHPQPARRHRPAGAGVPRRARSGDAAPGGGAGRGHRALDGRRARHRRARGAEDHEGGRRRGSACATHRRRRGGVPVRVERGRRARSNGPTTPSGTPSTRRTTSGCSSRASPTTSATCRRSAPRPTSSGGCGRTWTPAPPTSRRAILPLGSNKDEIVASSRRTREFLASLAPELT